LAEAIVIEILAGLVLAYIAFHVVFGVLTMGGRSRRYRRTPELTPEQRKEARTARNMITRPDGSTYPRPFS
jgi:hypothetical protein